MPTPKKPSATPPPSQGWRSRLNAPPGSNNAAELSAARQRASSWSLGNILSGGAKGVFNNWMALTQQPLSNIANMLPGRIVDDVAPRTLPEMLRRTSLGSDISSMGYAMSREPRSPNAPERFLPGEAMPSTLPSLSTQSPPLDPNVFGGRSQAIAYEVRRRKEEADRRKKEAAKQADAIVAQQDAKPPLVERVLSKTPLAPLFDSRGGLQASAEAAGYSPEAGQVMELANPLNWSPLDASWAPIEAAARLKAGKPLLGAFKYEGVLPAGRRPFQPHAPLPIAEGVTPIGPLRPEAPPSAPRVKAKEGSIAARNQAEQAAKKASARQEFRRSMQAEVDAQDAAGIGPRSQFQSEWDNALSAERANAADAAALRDLNEPAVPKAEQRARGWRKLFDAEKRATASAAQQSFRNEWDAALAAERQAAVQQFDNDWRSAVAESSAESWAAEKSAARAESAGFSPDPTPAVQGGWRSHMAAPTKPPEPPMLDRAAQPLNNDFVAHGLRGGDAEFPMPAPRPAALPGQAAWDAELAAARQERGNLNVQSAVDRVLPPPAMDSAGPIGWRRYMSSSNAPAVPPVEPPRAPLQSAAPIVPPRIPEAPSVPQNASQAPVPPIAPDVAPMLAKEPAVAPPQSPSPIVPPTSPPQAAALSAPAVPQYERVGVEGVREPAAMPAVGAGDAPPAGAPDVAPPPPAYAPDPVKPPSRRVENLAKRWSSMTPKEKQRAQVMLTPAEKEELIRVVSAPATRTPKYTASGGVAFFGATPQVVEEMVNIARDASRVIGGALDKTGEGVLRLTDAVKGLAHAALQRGGGWSPGVKKITSDAKALVDWWFSKRLTTDKLPEAAKLDEMLDDYLDKYAGFSMRAQDETAALSARGVAEPDRLAADAALRNGSQRRALRQQNPTLARTVDEVRKSIDMETQRQLAAQFQVSEKIWDALGDAEKRELGRWLNMQDATPAMSAAGTTSPASPLDALKVATLARLKASGAMIKNAEGKWVFKDSMLDVDQALDNLGSYLPRKYAAFEGGKGFDPVAVVNANPQITPDERRWLLEEFAPRMKSAFAARDMGQVQQFIERSNISPNLRQALGELKSDPAYTASLALHDLRRSTALSQLRQAIATNPSWVVPVDGDIAEAAQQWGLKGLPTRLDDDTTRFGILADRFVHPEVADVLQTHFGAHEPGSVARAGQTLTNVFKWAKTIPNVDSHVRQFIQNFVQGDLAGAGAVGHIAHLKTAAQALANKDALYEMARDAGLFRGSFYDAELAQSLHGAMMALPQGTSMEFLGRFGELVSAAKTKFEGAWQFSDDLNRLAVFNAQIEKGATPAEALRHVRETMYDGSKLSRFERVFTGRGLSRTLATPGKAAGFVDLLSSIANAPFGAATIFAGRNAVRSLLGMKKGRWVPFSDPSLALRASKYWLVPMLLNRAMSEEDDASKPSFSQPVLDKVLPVNVGTRAVDSAAEKMFGASPNITARFLGTDGKPQFVDVSSLLPWGEAARTVYDTMDGKASVMRALPGLGLNPLAQLGVDLAGNEDSFTNRPIYNEAMSGPEKAAYALGHATRVLGPNMTPGIPGALAMAAGGQGDFLENMVRFGGSSFQRLGAGFYNDAIAGRSNTDAHVPDYNMRDWTLPRAALSALGVRTYEGDAERNSKLRNIERGRRLKTSEAEFKALQRRPGRSDEQKAEDRSRFAETQRRLREGKPVRWDPWSNQTLQRILLGN